MPKLFPPCQCIQLYGMTDFIQSLHGIITTKLSRYYSQLLPGQATQPANVQAQETMRTCFYSVQLHTYTETSTRMLKKIHYYSLYPMLTFMNIIQLHYMQTSHADCLLLQLELLRYITMHIVLWMPKQSMVHVSTNLVNTGFI